MKVNIGQALYLTVNNPRNGEDKDIFQVTVSKIGRKYFEVSPEWYGRFEISTMKHDNGHYTSKYKVYLSIQEIEDEKERVNLIAKIKKQYFPEYGQNPLTLAQLRAVDNLLCKKDV